MAKRSLPRAPHYWESLTPAWKGVLAQLVERLNGIEEVRGSNPLGSTFQSSPKFTPKCSWGTVFGIIATSK